MTPSGKYNHCDASTYLDGVPFKINENCIPPKPVTLPAGLQRHLKENLDSILQESTFDFSLCQQVLEKSRQEQEAREQRKARLAAEEEKKRAKFQKELDEKIARFMLKAEALAAAASTSSSIPTSSLSLAPVQAQVVANQNSDFSSILTPLPMPAPTKTSSPVVPAKESFNISDFEADTSSPFDNMELKTINDMEELAHVLQRNCTSDIKPKDTYEYSSSNYYSQVDSVNSRNVSQNNEIPKNTQSIEVFGSYNSICGSQNSNSRINAPICDNSPHNYTFSVQQQQPSQYSQQQQPHAQQQPSAQQQQPPEHQQQQQPPSHQQQQEPPSHHQQQQQPPTHQQQQQLHTHQQQQQLPTHQQQQQLPTHQQQQQLPTHQQQQQLPTHQQQQQLSTHQQQQQLPTHQQQPQQQHSNFYFPNQQACMYVGHTAAYQYMPDNYNSQVAYPSTTQSYRQSKEGYTVHTLPHSTPLESSARNRSSKSVPDIFEELQREASFGLNRSTAVPVPRVQPLPVEHIPPLRPASFGSTGLENWKPWPELDSPVPSEKQDLQPVVPPKTTKPTFRDSISKLPEDMQKLAHQLSEMGFPPDRVARAYEAVGQDHKKILDYLLQVQALEERGFPISQVELAMGKLDLGESKALKFLPALGQLVDLGFSEEQASSALVKTDCDWEKALDSLLS